MFVAGKKVARVLHQQQAPDQAIPIEVKQERTSSPEQPAHGLLVLRLALGFAAWTLLFAAILLGPEAFATWAIWTSQVELAYCIGMLSLAIVLGLLGSGPLITSAWRRKRRLALASTAWVLTLASGPTVIYVMHLQQFEWALFVLSGTVLGALIVVILLAADPWTTDVLPGAYRLALGTIGFSSLIAAVLLWTRSPWWYQDVKLGYAFVGVVVAMVIVIILLVVELRPVVVERWRAMQQRGFPGVEGVLGQHGKRT
jgi:hypothetical protein